MAKNWHTGGVAMAVSLMMGLAACASGPADSAGSTSNHEMQADVPRLEIGKLNFEPTKYCGDKPMKIGHITGFGGNTWMLEVKALIEKFEEFCPNATGIEYYDANGDVAKFNSTINAWASQGFDVIYAFDGVFGTQSLPAFRAAQEAGVIVTAGNVPLGNDAVPESVTASLVLDVDSVGREWVDFLDEAEDDGTSKVLLIGGLAGNPQDPDFIEGMKAHIEEIDAEVEFLQDAPLVGNNDVAKSVEAATAAIQKYPEIDGLVLTNVAVAPAVLRVFQNAGRDVPAIAGIGATSGAICAVRKIREKSPDLQMLTLDGSPNFAPFALVKGIAKFQGIDAPELGPDDAETYFTHTPYVDTLNDQMPECDPSLPDGADPTVALTAEELAEAVK